jgi:hypothetical protein
VVAKPIREDAGSWIPKAEVMAVAHDTATIAESVGDRPCESWDLQIAASIVMGGGWISKVASR